MKTIEPPLNILTRGGGQVVFQRPGQIDTGIAMQNLWGTPPYFTMKQAGEVEEKDLA